MQIVLLGMISWKFIEDDLIGLIYWIAILLLLMYWEIVMSKIDT